jgi:hypothetical protein
MLGLVTGRYSVRGIDRQQVDMRWQPLTGKVTDCKRGMEVALLPKSCLDSITQVPAGTVFTCCLVRH